MAAANLMVGFAVLAMFGFVLKGCALLGKLGYEQGWWGDSLDVVAIAVVVAIALTALIVRWVNKLVG